MHSGLIATDLGPSKELLGGKLGFLVQANNKEQFVKAVMDLINDEKLCLKFGLEGERRVKKIFDQKESTLHIQNIIKNFADNSL